MSETSDRPKKIATTEDSGEFIGELKDAAGVLDAWLMLAIKIAITISISFVIFWPQTLPIMSKINFDSVDIDIFGVKTQFASSEQLIKLRKALASRGVDLSDDGKLTIDHVDLQDIVVQKSKLQSSVDKLTAQNMQLSQSLSIQKALLDRATAALDPGKKADGPAPADVVAKDTLANASLVQAIDKASSEVIAQQESAAKLTSEVKKVVADTLAPSPGTKLPAVGFGIVFSSDDSIKSAMNEIQKARKPNIGANPVYLYHRGKWFASVAYYGERKTANADLLKFAPWPTAYVVDISAWCPTPVLEAQENGEIPEILNCQI
jgi:hypothetical protein